MFISKRVKSLAKVVALFMCTGISATASANWSDKARGFSVVPSSQNSLCTSQFFQSVRNLKSMGANMVSIVVPYSQQTLDASDIYPYSRTPTDQALACGIQYVQSEGMRFALHLSVDVPGWRANIDPVDRDKWFAQMGAIASRYARDFASPYGADHMSIGTEMYKVVSNVYDSRNADTADNYRWPDIIQDVRSNYSGPIIYNAQHSGSRSAVFEDNDLMPNLDLLGFSAYFPLNASDRDGLVAEWQRIESQILSRAFNRYGKNLVISEIGYRPCSFALSDPFNAGTPCDYDGNIQALAWEGALAFFADRSYLYGIVGGWAWEDNAFIGGPGDTNYTPWNKPAAQTIRNYWTPAGSVTQGFVFSRTDKDEFRWVLGDQNIWISAQCAANFGGATRFGDWVELNNIAPGFDQAADPCPIDDDQTPGSGGGDGFVFSRTDKTEFRWVIGGQNIWITAECAASLGGATSFGDWVELNNIAPGFDQATNPCTTDGGGSTPGGDGYVFSRTDKNEFRWVLNGQNIWITPECAASLGGATRFGDWVELNVVAPGFDQATSPCPTDGGGSTPGGGDGYVFSRTDKNEFRWVSGGQNIWISAECAASLGGATRFGDWVELNVVAPGFDQATNPCIDGGGSTPGGSGGYVFSRTDKTEFRWVIGGQNIWITAECAASLGGATRFGVWADVEQGFDQAAYPCS